MKVLILSLFAIFGIVLFGMIDSVYAEHYDTDIPLSFNLTINDEFMESCKNDRYHIRSAYIDQPYDNENTLTIIKETSFGIRITQYQNGGQLGSPSESIYDFTNPITILNNDNPVYTVRFNHQVESGSFLFRITDIGITNLNTDEFCHIKFVYDDPHNDKRIINLIARTFNLDIPDEPKQKERDPNERSKYQVCFDKKERFKTELSELQSRFSLLETEHTTLQFQHNTLQTNNTQTRSDLAEALFTIEKLTTELNDAKKKIEELESPN